VYKNPFEDDPISEEEHELSFDFDPRRDYAAEIDGMLRPWTPPTVKILDNHPISAAFSETVLREYREKVVSTVMVDGKPKKTTRVVVKGVPHIKSFRAVDPAGNLSYVTVSTCRIDRDHPTGDDGLGTDSRVVGMKQKRGWLFIEQEHPQAKHAGKEYLAWCLAVSQYRKQIHAAHERKEEHQWMEAKKQEALALAREQANITGAITGRAIAEAVKDAIAAEKTERRGRKPDAE